MITCAGLSNGVGCVWDFLYRPNPQPACRGGGCRWGSCVGYILLRTAVTTNSGGLFENTLLAKGLETPYFSPFFQQVLVF